jgi:hypothetical protein
LLAARLLPGTENASGLFWSPDSRFLAFAVGTQLKKVDVSVEPPQTLADNPNLLGSGSWNREEVIVFGGRGSGPIHRVPAAGGVPTGRGVLAARTQALHAPEPITVVLNWRRAGRSTRRRRRDRAGRRQHRTRGGVPSTTEKGAAVSPAARRLKGSVACPRGFRTSI